MARPPCPPVSCPRGQHRLDPGAGPRRRQLFSATEIEAQWCRGEPVAVVGGANSAGQATLFLASRGSSVDIIVREDPLGAAMSDYLVRRIREHDRIAAQLGTEVTAREG